MAVLKLPAPNAFAFVDPMLFDFHWLIRRRSVDLIKAIPASGIANLGPWCVSRLTLERFPDDVKVSCPGTLDEDSAVGTPVQFLCDHFEVCRKDF